MVDQTYVQAPDRFWYLPAELKKLHNILQLSLDRDCQQLKVAIPHGEVSPMCVISKDIDILKSNITTCPLLTKWIKFTAARLPSA